MQNFIKDIQLDLVIMGMNAHDKKKAFQSLAKKAAPFCGLPESELFEKLMLCEEKASSGIGDGVAIPHIKSEKLKKPFVALVRLSQPIPFNALDDEPVDIICLVLSKDSEGPVYLRRLSRITRMLRHEDLRRNLREAKDENAMRAALSDSSEWMIAA